MYYDASSDFDEKIVVVADSAAAQEYNALECAAD